VFSEAKFVKRNQLPFRGMGLNSSMFLKKTFARCFTGDYAFYETKATNLHELEHGFSS